MDKSSRLASIAERISSDTRLEIARSATQAVPGEGHPDAELLLIGEAPGAQEDREGRPFVGASGKFLAQMLESIGMTRSDVFITNIVKYRPPGNRDPLPEEIEVCWPYLEEQIAVIEPLLIVTLGRHAMNRFLPDARISTVHGQPKRRAGRVYYPLYHPAAALYNGSMRAVLQEDFTRIPSVLTKVREENMTTTLTQERLL